MAADKTIAVIGSGLGGLSAAIRLAQKDYKVHVFEKNLTSGGKAGRIDIGQFHFDTGPTLLTMPFVLEELFTEAGENITDHLEINSLDTLCRYFFPDKTILNAYSNIDKLAEEISKKTSDSKQSVNKYFRYCEGIYNLTADLFMFNSFFEKTSLFKKSALKTLLGIRKIDPFRTVHEANKSFFTDQKTIQLFDRYSTYNGSSPFLAPATLNIIPYVENKLGGYFVRSGIHSIPFALTKLAEKLGVEFHFGSLVEKILLNGSNVSGIRVNGCNQKFNIVVSNCDVTYTYKHLLSSSPSDEQKAEEQSDPSSSALVFYWGIKGVNPLLGIHNILFTGNYRNEFDQLFRSRVCPDDPTIYIFISSKFNSSDAPEGCENWFVMINAPYNSGQGWEKMVISSRKKIIDKIKTLLGIDVENLIIEEEILTPVDLEYRTNSWKGSIYGPSSNNRFSAFKRQRNRSLKYKGLYFTGGSAHPGGGIPLVLLSGKITSELISKFHK